MGKYIKKFDTHAEYSTYINSQDKILPNVSYCEDNNEVHYTPYTPPQPIAPVGKAQVFANPQCTEYADGTSADVWVRLNQNFGFNDETRWGTYGEKLSIYTPTSEYPSDPWGVIWYVDFPTADTNGPYVSGQIVKCSYIGGVFDFVIDNPQVIFE